MHAGVIAPDQTTFDYVDTRAPGYDYTPLYADEGARYTEEYTIDVSKLEPLVAAPHSPDNRRTARECADVAIDRVYIGSCTGAPAQARIGSRMLRRSWLALCVRARGASHGGLPLCMLLLHTIHVDWPCGSMLCCSVSLLRSYGG